MADTSLILCTRRHGLPVILPDFDIVGKHVYRSERAILAKQVCVGCIVGNVVADCPGEVDSASSGSLLSVHG